jgi:hypothetical protein
MDRVKDLMFTRLASRWPEKERGETRQAMGMHGTLLHKENPTQQFSVLKV